MERQVLKIVCGAVVMLALVGARPYEFEWAGRTKDDRPVLMRLEDAAGWKVEPVDAVATLTTGVARVLFGDGVMHLDYRAAGKSPSVRLSPPEPVAVPPGADTVSLWIWGNNVSYARDKTTPPVHFVLHFADAEGRPFSFDLYWVRHLEWFLVQRKFSPDERARLAKGGRFTGLTVSDGKNEQDRFVEFTSLAVYREDLKPLTFKPRAQRPNRVFPDAPAGVNTGAGSLDFPNRALTVVPPTKGRFGTWRLPTKAWDWSDMAFIGPDGRERRFAAGGGVFFASADPKTRPVPPADGTFAVTTNAVSPLDVVYCGECRDGDREAGQGGPGDRHRRLHGCRRADVATDGCGGLFLSGDEAGRLARAAGRDAGPGLSDAGGLVGSRRFEAASGVQPADSLRGGHHPLFDGRRRADRSRQRCGRASGDGDDRRGDEARLLHASAFSLPSRGHVHALETSVARRTACVRSGRREDRAHFPGRRHALPHRSSGRGRASSSAGGASDQRTQVDHVAG